MSAEIRPRGHWEAIDLGFKLVRPHYFRMVATSCILTLPVFVLIQLLCWQSLGYGAVLMWWIKPLWERVHLHVLSRSLFGETPAIRDTLREFPDYGFRQWFLWLTLRRFSATRSLDLPVTQLELLNGADRTRRLAIVSRGDTASGGLWLMIVCVHMESFILLGGLVLAQFLVPESTDANVVRWYLGFDVESAVFHQIVTNLSVQLAAIVVAPFYVGGGFALYINRRTILEAWDLEIVFRRTAKRLKERAESRARGRAIVAMLAGLLLSSFTIWSSPVQASSSLDEPIVAPPAAELEVEVWSEAQKAIRVVLEGDAFHELDTVRVPKILFDWPFHWDVSQESSGLPDWWINLFAWLAVFLANIAEFTLIALVMAIVVYLVHRYRNELAEWVGLQRGGASAYRPPSQLFGMDVTPDSLPDDVIETVLRLWREGGQRAALALLYRATLIELMRDRGVEFGAGFTEGDCMRVTHAQVDAACAGYFESLTRHWQRLAYAHRPLGRETLEELCSTWPSFFQPRDEIEEIEDSDSAG